VSDEDFLAGRFDTSFIDRKLGQPANRSLQPIDDCHEELAAIAAAVFLFTKPSAATAAALPASRWRDTGRSEALR